MWTTLEIERPGLIGSQARAAIAKINDRSSRLPESFFHYAKGQAISDRQSPLRIGANGHKVFITGVGRVGRDMIYGHAVDIVSLFRDDDPDWTVGFRLREGDLDAQASMFPRHYRLHGFATRRIKRADREKGIDHPDLKKKLQGIVADALANELAEQGVNGLRPEVRIVRINKLAGVVKHGKAFPIFSVDLTINAKLDGPWAIGSLKADGQGRLTSRPRPSKAGGSHADAQ